jgi:hypothetical protein
MDQWVCLKSQKPTSSTKIAIHASKKQNIRKKLSFATDADIRDLTQTIDKTFDVWFWTPNYLHGLQEKYMILFGKSAP